MAKLSWLPEALDDIQRLHAFLYQKDQLAASKAAVVIHKAATVLATNPQIGRPMPDETSRRELFAAFGAGAYVLRYRLVQGDPVIIRVWHSKELRTV